MCCPIPCQSQLAGLKWVQAKSRQAKGSVYFVLVQTIMFDATTPPRLDLNVRPQLCAKRARSAENALRTQSAPKVKVKQNAASWCPNNANVEPKQNRHCHQVIEGNNIDISSANTYYNYFVTSPGDTQHSDFCARSQRVQRPFGHGVFASTHPANT